MRIHLRSFLAVLMATCFWTAAIAQQPTPLSLQQAVRLAVEKNPNSQIALSDQGRLPPRAYRPVAKLVLQ